MARTSSVALTAATVHGRFPSACVDRPQTSSAPGGACSGFGSGCGSGSGSGAGSGSGSCFGRCDPDNVFLFPHSIFNQQSNTLNFYSKYHHHDNPHYHQKEQQSQKHDHWAFLNNIDDDEDDIINLNSSVARPTPSPCVHSFRPFHSNMPHVDILHNHNHHHHQSSSSTDTAAPNSPPDLTGSKSSKSSGSFRSSCLTDHQDQDNLSHFEDIALADSGRDSADDLHIQHHNHQHIRNHERKQQQQQHHHTNRPPQRRVASAAPSNRAPPPEPLRDATNMNRPRYPSLKNHVNALPGPNRQMRRGFTSPSTPSLTMGGRPRSSRSNSPNGHALSDGGSRSPRSAVSSKGLGLPKHALKPRKTVKELEAEYHDSDEEVPDDAVIWNVPISPRPPFQSSTPSSPTRTVSQSSLTPDFSANNSRQASAPDALNGASPRSATRPTIPHSVTVPNFPASLSRRNSTRKSWTDDLSQEAREVAAALEEHVSEETRRSARNSSSHSPPRPAMKLRTKTSIMELPPVQKGNVMIDPLPVSKEKEAVLTRTRPSWLPPKCQKEERKHIKEWERMMAAAEQAEKKRLAKEAEQQQSRKQMEGNIARIWEEHVLPNWDAVIREPRTRELWWRGVTPRDRGTVWSRAIGNELSLTETSYKTALKRARALQASVNALPDEERTRHVDAGWLAAITRDVPTVFTDLGIFGHGAPLHDTLEDVLLAYSAYRSDVGYVYGVHLIAGLLTLNMNAHTAFIALANILNRPMSLAFLVQEQTGMNRIYEMILATLKYKLPRLHDHLLDPRTGFTDGPEEWLYPFLSTLGTQHLGPDVCSRLWDIAVFEGDKCFVRAVVGILSLLESKLYGDREEILRLVGWRTSTLGFGEEEVVKAVREAGKVSPSSSPAPSI